MHTPPEAPGFRYVHDGIGSNWRMTEMQAAIGLMQLEKLDSWVEKRRENAEVWTRVLGQSPAVRLPDVPEGILEGYLVHEALARMESEPGGDPVE